MTDMVVGLRLKADASGFVGEVRIARDEVRKVGEEAAKAGDGAAASAAGTAALGEALAETAGKAKDASTALGEAGQGMKDAGQAAETASTGLRAQTDGSAEMASEIALLVEALAEFRSGLEDSGKSAEDGAERVRETQKELKELREAARSATGDLRGLSAASRDLTAASRQQAAEVDRSGDAAQRSRRPTDELEGSTRRYSAAARVAGQVAGALAIAVIAGAFKASQAVDEQDRALRRLDGVLRATGNSTGLTARELNAFVTQMKGATRATEADLREAVETLATFPTISGKAFKETVILAQDMAAVFGGSLTQNLQILATAMEDPVNGLAMFNEMGLRFTHTEAEVGKQLVETGRHIEWQTSLTDKLRESIGGAGAGDNGGLTGAHKELFEAAKDAFMALSRSTGAMDAGIWSSQLFARALRGVADAFGEVSDAEKLAGLNQEIADLEKPGSGIARANPARASRLEALKAERTAIINRTRAEEESNAAQEAAAAIGADLAKQRHDQEQQDERARTKAKEDKERLDAQREREAQQAEGQRRHRLETIQDLRDELDLQTRLQGVELARATYVRQQVRRLGEGATPEDIQQTEQLAGQIFDREQARRDADERTRLKADLLAMRKGWDENTAAVQAYFEALDTIDAAKAMGLTEEAAAAQAALDNGAQRLIDLTIKRGDEMIRLAALSEEERDAELEASDIAAEAAQMGIVLSEEQRRVLVEILKLRNQMIGAIEEQKEAEKRAAEDVERIFEDTKRRIQDSFTDLFAAIFEDGLKGFKSFGKSITAALRNALAEGLSQKFIKPYTDAIFGDVSSGQKGMLEPLKKQMGELFGEGFTKSMGDLLGGAGMGYGLGKMAGSGTGGAIGGMLGQAVGGPLGAAIGGVLGGIVGGLFKSTPRTAGTVAVNAGGDLFAGDYGKKGGADIKDAQGLAGAAISQLRDLAKLLEVDFKSGFTLGQLGKYKDEFVFQENVTSIKDFGKKKSGGQRFESAEDAIAAAIESAIRRGILAGLTEVEEAVLRSAETLQDGLERILEGREVRDKIARFQNPLKFELDQLAKQQLRERELAVEFGYDLLALEKMHAEERLAIIEQFGEQAIASLRDAIEQLKTGSLSPLTPVDKLTEAQKAYAAAKKSGDNDALASAGVALVDAARAVYAGSEQFFAIYNEVLATLAAAEKSAQAEIDRQVRAAAAQAAAAAKAAEKPATTVTTPAGGISTDSAAIIAALEQLGIHQANTNASLQELYAMAADGSFARRGIVAA